MTGLEWIDFAKVYGPLLQAGATILTGVVLYVLRRLYHTMNSKMDRLLEVTAKAARAEGVLEGQAAAIEVYEAKIRLEKVTLEKVTLEKVT